MSDIRSIINGCSNDCILCKIGTQDTNLLEEYDRPIIKTEEFCVIPALGQFIEGYLLICPRIHFINLSIMDSDIYERFLEVKELVRSLLYDVYGQTPIFFEHGPTSYRMRGGSCIDHAHLHALPIDMTKPPSWLSEHLIGGRIQNIDSVIKCARAGKPYFFIECSNGIMYLYDAIDIQCQFGRQVIAREIGLLDQWDWRMYPNKENMIKTSRRLRARLESKSDSQD